jgi:hypothetical protein
MQLFSCRGKAYAYPHEPSIHHFPEVNRSATSRTAVEYDGPPGVLAINVQMQRVALFLGIGTPHYNPGRGWAAALAGGVDAQPYAALNRRQNSRCNEYRSPPELRNHQDYRFCSEGYFRLSIASPPSLLAFPRRWWDTSVQPPPGKHPPLDGLGGAGISSGERCMLWI